MSSALNTTPMPPLPSFSRMRKCEMVLPIMGSLLDPREAQIPYPVFADAERRDLAGRVAQKADRRARGECEGVAICRLQGYGSATTDAIAHFARLVAGRESQRRTRFTTLVVTRQCGDLRRGWLRWIHALVENFRIGCDNAHAHRRPVLETHLTLSCRRELVSRNRDEFRAFHGQFAITPANLGDRVVADLAIHTGERLQF